MTQPGFIAQGCGLRACGPAELTDRNLVPSVTITFEKAIKSESKALTNGIIALVKEPQVFVCPLCPREDTNHTMSKEQSESPSHTTPVGTFIPDFPISTTMKNK